MQTGESDSNKKYKKTENNSVKRKILHGIRP